MRYMGNKAKLTEFIEKHTPHSGKESPTFVDLFSGTATVGGHFRKLGYVVTSADILYLSYVMQRALIQLPLELKWNGFPSSGYQAALDELNVTPGVEGYIFQTFTPEGTKDAEHVRRYFSGDNGSKIDGIRQKVEEWRAVGRVSEDEYFFLLASVVESASRFSNVAGVYAAFLKQDDPRSLKPFYLTALNIPAGPPGVAHHASAEQVAPRISCDVLYLDPPYNSRQYAPNYHVLETIARYDNPEAKGVAGIRPYPDEKSKFCSKKQAPEALHFILKEATWQTAMLSYNSEGIMSDEVINQTLGSFGTVIRHQKAHRRFRSNSGGASRTKPVVSEYLYIVRNDLI